MFMDGEFDSIALVIGKAVYCGTISDVIPGGVVAYLVSLLVFHFEEADCLPG